MKFIEIPVPCGDIHDRAHPAAMYIKSGELKTTHDSNAVIMKNDLIILQI